MSPSAISRDLGGIRTSWSTLSVTSVLALAVVNGCIQARSQPELYVYAALMNIRVTDVHILQLTAPDSLHPCGLLLR